MNKKLVLYLVVTGLCTNLIAQTAAFKVTNSCGQTSKHDKSIAGELGLGQKISINGSIDLSSCLIGNNGSKIKTITLQKH